NGAAVNIDDGKFIMNGGVIRDNLINGKGAENTFYLYVCLKFRIIRHFRDGKYTRTYSESDTDGYDVYDQASGERIFCW
ncbi:MAG: hypothetical protein MJ092_04960, partial [Lachnospiraceae bacterium]|nr:hypothetical protein [Lachnospiraceae bacterium]